MDLARCGARGHAQLLDYAGGYLGRKRQAMSALEISQRLLSCEAIVAVRLNLIAQFDQCGLRGED